MDLRTHTFLHSSLFFITINLYAQGSDELIIYSWVCGVLIYGKFRCMCLRFSVAHKVHLVFQRRQLKITYWMNVPLPIVVPCLFSTRGVGIKLHRFACLNVAGVFIQKVRAHLLNRRDFYRRTLLRKYFRLSNNQTTWYFFVCLISMNNILNIIRV